MLEGDDNITILHKTLNLYGMPSKSPSCLRSVNLAVKKILILVQLHRPFFFSLTSNAFVHQCEQCEDYHPCSRDVFKKLKNFLCSDLSCEWDDTLRLFTLKMFYAEDEKWDAWLFRQKWMELCKGDSYMLRNELALFVYIVVAGRIYGNKFSYVFSPYHFFSLWCEKVTPW